MPERGFNTDFWADPFVQKLPFAAKGLYIYLSTNAHCNQAGLYQITPASIAFETKLGEQDIPELLKLLEPRIAWYPDHNLVWVKDFIKEQAKSSKFLAAAAKCLTTISHNGAVHDLLDYNLKRYSLSIPYRYYIDRLSILTRASASASVSVSGSEKGDEVEEKGERDIRGEELGKKASTTPVAETAEISNLLGFVETLEGWRFQKSDDLAWLTEFCRDWTDFNLELAKACRDWHSGRMQAKHKGVWKGRFRHWMEKERDKKEKRSAEKKEKPIEGLRIER